KGAFTDARESRKGYFEEANGGTIFLDEVADLPLSTQVRLLRVLESGEFLKVGSSKVLKTDVRIVAATNVNIPEAIQKGSFREDLFYRLNSIAIQVPALRERKEDIPLLFRKFSSDLSEKYRMPLLQVTEEALHYLVNYTWKGNVRELKNVTEQITIIEKERLINLEKLQTYLPQSSPAEFPVLFGQKENTGLNEREILYSVLFDMQKDIHELKKVIASILKNDELPMNGKVNASTSTHSNPGPEAFTIIPSNPTSAALVSTHHFQNASPYANFETDFTEETVNQIQKDTVSSNLDTLSLEKTEKDLILKALDKHHGNRRKAAEDLGISERTIYRKIKDYEIEIN
ncbi:MAG: sigma 54-interacting transcriptional regulator, partial [Bacteroidales bacterium]